MIKDVWIRKFVISEKIFPVQCGGSLLLGDEGGNRVTYSFHRFVSQGSIQTFEVMVQIHIF